MGRARVWHRSSPAPAPMGAGGAPSSSLRLDVTAGSNFGPDAPPKGKKGKFSRAEPRGPKGPIRVKPNGRIYSTDEDGEDSTDSTVEDDSPPASSRSRRPRTTPRSSDRLAPVPARFPERVPHGTSHCGAPSPTPYPIEVPVKQHYVRLAVPPGAPARLPEAGRPSVPAGVGVEGGNNDASEARCASATAPGAPERRRRQTRYPPSCRGHREGQWRRIQRTEFETTIRNARGRRGRPCRPNSAIEVYRGVLDDLIAMRLLKQEVKRSS